MLNELIDPLRLFGDESIQGHLTIFDHVESLFPDRRGRWIRDRGGN